MSNKIWHDYVKKYMTDHNVTYAVASKLAKPSYKLYKSKKSVVVLKKDHQVENHQIDSIENHQIENHQIDSIENHQIDSIENHQVGPIENHQVENYQVGPIENHQIDSIENHQVENLQQNLINNLTTNPIDQEDSIDNHPTNLPMESLSVRIAPYICFINIFFLYLWTD